MKESGNNRRDVASDNVVQGNFRLRAERKAAAGKELDEMTHHLNEVLNEIGPPPQFLEHSTTEDWGILAEDAADLGAGIDEMTRQFNNVLNEKGPPPELPENVIVFRPKNP